MFKYLKYITVLTAIIDKASDGKITRDEVVECLQGVLPEQADQIVKDLQAALADGHLSVGEVFRALANSKLLD